MPGYPKYEKYAPTQTPEVNTLEKRFLGLTNVQIGLFTLPTLIILTSVILILMNRKARKNPAVYVSLAIGILHLYHHYTLARLQNKYVQ